jgi:hypothetical protein
MIIEEIIEQIDAEIHKLQQAKVLLEGTKISRAPGRPKKNLLVSRILAAVPAKRVVSNEAKAKIAEAQRKRWAKSKRAEKKAAKKATALKTAKAPTVARSVKALKIVKVGKKLSPAAEAKS